MIYTEKPLCFLKVTKVSLEDVLKILEYGMDFGCTSKEKEIVHWTYYQYLAEQ